MTDNVLKLTVQPDDETKPAVEHEFVIAPKLGHFMALEDQGIDLLGTSGNAELEVVIANPRKFLQVLAVVIGSDDDQFQMPALAGLFDGDDWVNARRVLINSLKSFFLSSGNEQLAAALDVYEDAATRVTSAIAQSLTSGELRGKIDGAIQDTTTELLSVDGS